MEFCKAMTECLTGNSEINEKEVLIQPHPTDVKQPIQSQSNDIATSILDLLNTAEKPGASLRAAVQHILHSDDSVHTQNWYEGIAKRVHQGIEALLRSGTPIGQAFREMYTEVAEAGNGFVTEHPVFAAVAITVVALGILYLLWPYGIEALGFTELGPLEGSWAATWQSRIGDVEKRSLFAWLQRLGMTMGK